MYSAPNLTDDQHEFLAKDREHWGIYEHEMNFDLFCEAIGERAASEKTVILEMLADANMTSMHHLYRAYSRHNDNRMRKHLLGQEVQDIVHNELVDSAARIAFALCLYLDYKHLAEMVDWNVEQYIKQIVDTRYPHGLRHQPTEADRAEVAAEWRMEEKRNG